MAVLAIVIVVAVGVFGVAFVSPRYGDAIKSWVRSVARRAKSWLQGAPKVIHKSTAKSIDVSQKILHKSVDKGKKGRHKAPF